MAPKEETGANRELRVSAVTYHDDADYTEMRSTVDFIMTALGEYNNFKVKPGKNPTYLNGRYGEIIWKGKKIGEIGEIHPVVLLNYKLEFPVSALELNLQAFL